MESLASVRLRMRVAGPQSRFANLYAQADTAAERRHAGVTAMAAARLSARYWPLPRPVNGD